MQNDERRGFMRLSADTSASITHLDNRSTTEVKLVDLSAGGCSFYASIPLAAGDTLEFAVHGTSRRIEPLIKRGHVVRIIDDDQGKLVAFEFDA